MRLQPLLLQVESLLVTFGNKIPAAARHMENPILYPKTSVPAINLFLDYYLIVGVVEHGAILGRVHPFNITIFYMHHSYQLP
jgi:hypothetical protein